MMTTKPMTQRTHQVTVERIARAGSLAPPIQDTGRLTKYGRKSIGLEVTSTRSRHNN